MIWFKDRARTVSTPLLRKMVRETRMDKSSLIYPMFVKEGTNIKEEIPTMPGPFRYSVDRLPQALEEFKGRSSKRYAVWYSRP